LANVLFGATGLGEALGEPESVGADCAEAIASGAKQPATANAANNLILLVIFVSSRFCPAIGAPFANQRPELTRVPARNPTSVGTSFAEPSYRLRVTPALVVKPEEIPLLPHMKPGSATITTSSVNAYNPDRTIIDYYATKGAIMIFTKGLAKQLAQRAFA
jgi:hypothetical protein